MEFKSIINWAMTSPHARHRTLIKGLTLAVTPPAPTLPLSSRQWRLVLSRTVDVAPSPKELEVVVKHLVAYHDDLAWRFLLDFTHRQENIAGRQCYVLEWLGLVISDLWHIPYAEKKAIINRLDMPKKCKKALLAQVTNTKDKTHVK